MKPARSFFRQRGFTLIEVLVALMLMAILSLISWRALDSVMTTSERLESNADEINAMLRVLGQLQYDISLHASNDILPARPVAAATAGGSTANSATNAGSAATGSATPAAQTTIAILPAGIRLVEQQNAPPLLALVRAASSGDGAWQQVYWYLDGTSLRRAVGMPSRQLPLPDPDPAGDIVLTDVSGFGMRAWLPGRGWTALPADDAAIAATGLEITIQRQQHGRNVPYRKVLLLP